jgi:hypothetical protein
MKWSCVVLACLALFNSLALLFMLLALASCLINECYREFVGSCHAEAERPKHPLYFLLDGLSTDANQKM